MLASPICQRTPAVLLLLALIQFNVAHAQTPADDLQSLILRGRAFANLPKPDKTGMVTVVKDCIRVARAAASVSDTKTVKSAWNAVIGGLDIAGDEIPRVQQARIRVAAARALREADAQHEAIAAVQPVLSSEDDSSVEQAEQLLLKIGAKNYQAGQTSLARLAWLPLAEREGGHPGAELGLAWLALAEKPSEHQSIADAMQAFAKKYPEHPEAPVTLGQATLHFAKAGLVEEALTTFANYAGQVEQQKLGVADDVINALVDLEVEPTLLQPVAAWLLQPPSRLSSVKRAALVARATKQDPASFETAIGALIRMDDAGRDVAAVAQDVGGELVAPLIVARLDDPQISVANKLWGVKWLARNGQWMSIALAAADLSPDQFVCDPSDSDSHVSQVSLTRLVAESYVRTSDQAKAHDWWAYSVDRLGDESFVSRLRLAECLIAPDTIDEARQRVTEASEAAGEDSGRIALVQFLKAAVAIQELSFEQARQSYESIVRNVAVTADLRARAQWMLGETHFMQNDSPAAIAAYRLVEGIAPDSEWAAASLIQAGKSFERLGRTQAAAVCYGTLLSRFADSQHAKFALDRVAVLSPEARPHPQPSDPILRR